jgi:GH43 family beta-xylosidase
MTKKLIDGLDIYPAKKSTSTKAQKAISRSEILDEIWAADKHTHNGKWYVSMSDVCAILGDEHAKQER